MLAIVHFAVGLSFGMLLLLFVDWRPREEFAFLVASGLWAMVPDAWWLFREVGVEPLASAGRHLHESSVLVDLFWFHRVLDGLETGRPKLEAGVAMALFVCCAVAYYALNDWMEFELADSDSR